MSSRLRQFRVMRGLSLEKMSKAIGGIVTKQALSKYELGKVRPRPHLLTKLAEVLDVEIEDLRNGLNYQVSFTVDRERSGLDKKTWKAIDNGFSLKLQDRYLIQQYCEVGMNLPVQSWEAFTGDDIEKAACRLRSNWGIGSGPIGNLSSILESRSIHVLALDAPAWFHSISAFLKDHHGKPCAAAVATRKYVPAGWRRFRLAREVARLIFKPIADDGEEKRINRFAAAFLAPAERLNQEIQGKRSVIHLEEIERIKRKFGIDSQALLRRLADLEIITPDYYRDCCVRVNQAEWSREDAHPSVVDGTPEWVEEAAKRFLGEGKLTKDYAERVLGREL